MGKLDNQSVWITGGGTGIGAAAALTLAQAGAEVFVSGRRLQPLE
ncbi:MAG TPA: SDR family NAD(P)-dependent oxidoreductase, partial [Gammaproteobacteria bacterium]|nr:SDR family NAD(P)-dependent oxidoreductase [Gammaproteobacteria bacterium]